MVQNHLGESPRRNSDAALGKTGRLSQVLAYLAFLMIAVEALLRLGIAASPRLAQVLEPNTRVPAFIDDPDLGRRPNPRFPEHDSAGYCNFEVLERADLVALGDSQTYGVCAPRSGAWPRQLATRTGLSVYNMSSGMWAPPHYLRLLDEVTAK